MDAVVMKSCWRSRNSLTNSLRTGASAPSTEATSFELRPFDEVLFANPVLSMKAFVVKSCLLIELSVTKLAVVKWLFPEKLFVITLAVVIGSLVVMGASVVMVIASTRLSVRLTSLIQRLDEVVSRRILL